MLDIEKLCADIEKLDPFAFAGMIGEKGESVINGMAEVVGSHEDAVTLFTVLVFGAVNSDGKLDEKEFGLIKPLLEDAVEKEVDYESAVEFMSALKTQKNEYNKMIISLSAMFGAVSENLKTDIVTLCLLICASDGKISKREKNWIAKIAG